MWINFIKNAERSDEIGSAKVCILTNKFETVQTIVLGCLNCVLHQFGRLCGRSCCMIRQAFQCNFLLSHQFACIFIHLRVVYAETAEYGKRLNDGNIGVRKWIAVFLSKYTKPPYEILSACRGVAIAVNSSKFYSSHSPYQWTVPHQ